MKSKDFVIVVTATNHLIVSDYSEKLVINITQFHKKNPKESCVHLAHHLTSIFEGFLCVKAIIDILPAFTELTVQKRRR